ncbi:unnamed protein product [Lactuca saligna]|uniref:Uncharacterized protein n=1 Tax=Lactuca saligna TaxID=75948 RepID=A0AA36EGR4_LACSI|nr:unnamed protein product [Lactuca saligna]
MLNRIEGVSESGLLPKQGGEFTKTVDSGSGENETKPPLKSKDLKGNEAFGSKGKWKLVDEEEEEEDLSEGAQLKRKKRDQDLDENLRVSREAKALEREARDA